MKRLSGKVVIVTGAANGIGLAVADLFAAEGASLLLVDQQEEALRVAATRLGPTVSWLAADVSAADTAVRYTEAVLQQYGRVDVAVLNAGIEGEIASFGKASLAAFERVMAVNVRSIWLGLSSLMPAMKASGGSIVTTSSVLGLRGAARMAPYCASKHAVIGLMRSAAAEGAADGIRVNTVNPGHVDTRMIEAIERARSPTDVGAARRANVARIPLGRYARIEEVAAMMLFLASDESSFCTGQTYVVDGGLMNG